MLCFALLLSALPFHTGKVFQPKTVVVRHQVCATCQACPLAGCACLLTSQAVRLCRSALTRCT